MIQARAIVPKDVLLDPKRMARAIENALDGAAEAAKVDFEVTTQTWKHKPEFKIRKSPGKRVISTDDKPFFFVTRGTRVRRALMSADFRAKTVPRQIRSRAGRGRVVVIKKTIKRPGIKAREFEEVIGEKWNKQLPVTLQRAIDAEV